MTDLFFQLAKADFNGEFWGTMCARELDADKEIINWPKTVAAVKAWSSELAAVTHGKNFGNIRDQHSNNAIGKLIEPPQIDEQNQRILVHGKVIDPVAIEKLQEGIYTGLSIGGAYENKKSLGNGAMEYTPRLAELSLVDKPCSPSATLSLVRADGSVMQKRFRNVVGFTPRREFESHIQKANREYTYRQDVANGCFRKPLSKEQREATRVSPNARRMRESLTFGADIGDGLSGHTSVSSGDAGSFHVRRRN